MFSLKFSYPQVDSSYIHSGGDTGLQTDVMNAYGNPGYGQQAKQYKTQQIQTATPEEILILLYEGAIRFLAISRKAIEAEDLEKAHNHLIKTQRIITELMLSLDMDIGGDVAQNLYSLYDYLHYRLVQANLKKDVTMIDEVLDHLRALKQTWEQAIKIAAREQAEQEALQQGNLPRMTEVPHTDEERNFSEGRPHEGQGRIYNV